MRNRILATLLIGTALIAAACGSDTPEVTTASEGAEPTAAPEPTVAVAPTEAPAAAASGDGVLGANTSAWAKNAGALPPEQRNGIYSEPPPMNIDTAATYRAVIATENGEMTFELLAANAPITVNNFVNLATDGFYNGVTFHRVLEDFMAQGGDPTGMGSGGPGYQFVNEYTPGIEFGEPGAVNGERGLLAMANAGPNTNGSQFFITFDQAGFLPASDYTVFGRLTNGDDALRAIRMREPSIDPDPGDLITSVTITKVG